MSTVPAPAADSPDIRHTRWRIDPERSSVELATLEDERLRVRGELHAAGKSTRLDLEGVIRPVGDELDIDVTTFADHRELGMTWNRLGMLRGPSKLIVRGRLVRDDR